MSDHENRSGSPSARQALATLFRVLAAEVAQSETPPAFAHAIAGSIRHRGNKVERCERVELREIAAALRAFAEIVVVCDAHMARGIQSVAACVDAQLDAEDVTAPTELVAHAPLPDREWKRCASCRKQFLFKGPPDGAVCFVCASKLGAALKKGGV